MKIQSPIYKALDERGKGRALPEGFAMQTMLLVASESRRRRRRALVLSVAGAVLAVVVAVAALKIYCSDIIMAACKDMAESFSGSSSELLWMLYLLPSAILLLALNLFLTRKLQKKLHNPA